MESGAIGEGCAAAREADAQHLLEDLLGVIQPDGLAGPSLAPKSLLLTSLRPTAPFVLLNVSIGDQAEIVPSRCGCPLERLGWTRQIHTVRSYDKLTAGGMVFLDVDVIRVLEEVLPARFGGSSTDYQLVEDQTGDGRSALRLLVDPQVGPLDEQAVAETFLAAIGGGSGVERLKELMWRQGGVLRVERSAPRLTSAGRILHLHQERGTGTPPATPDRPAHPST
jgi:hypothetical protein